MLEHFHKGQLGRIAVIGGSEDYAGAPYFSAMASARLGCDMSHVICTPGAATVIKSYSPNLMVHPLMRETPKPVHDTVASTSLHAKNPDTNVEVVAGHVIGMLDRVHALVIGPGLGRDALMHGTIARVIIAARNKNIPIVIDADALLTIQKEPKIIQGYRQAILTPNVAEFGRLCEALKVDAREDHGPGRVEALAKALGGVTIIQKGPHDYISNGTVTLIVDLEGGRKRSGGQGDTLTGSIATFLGWRKAYHDKLWDTSDSIFPAEETITLAAFGGAAITRDCSRLAFKKKGRSLQASDLTDEVHNAFMNLFGEVDGDAGNVRL